MLGVRGGDGMGRMVEHAKDGWDDGGWVGRWVKVISVVSGRTIRDSLIVAVAEVSGISGGLDEGGSGVVGRKRTLRKRPLASPLRRSARAGYRLLFSPYLSYNSPSKNICFGQVT